MKINWIWKRFKDLSGQEIQEIHLERQKVFVVEQNCAYQDADEYDISSWHLIGRLETGQLAAYARITSPQTKYQSPSFGRILTTMESRGQGFGREIIKQCIAKSHIEYPLMNIQISAQSYLTSFYSSFGFKVQGHPYDDEGIEHIDMVLTSK